MPTARQPASFASWPTTLPTAPLAALTTTVSPAFGAMMRFSPYHAGDARHADRAEIGRERHMRVVDFLHAACRSTCRIPASRTSPTTLSPTANFGFFDSTTSPTVPPIITSFSGCGAAYDLLSFMRPRMYGSSDR